MGGVALNTETVLHYTSNARDSIAGTLGYDPLAGGVYLISQSNKQFCSLDSRDARLGRAAFTDTPVRFNKQYLPLRIGDTVVDGVFFDTGALFSLMQPET